MQFPILKILGELRENLGPKLKELGVSPVIGSINTRHGRPSDGDDLKNCLAISFQSKDANRFIPIELRLPLVDNDGRREPTWKGATLWNFYWDQTWEMCDDTGWTYLRFGRGYEDEIFDGNRYSRYELLLRSFEKEGVVVLPADPSKRTENKAYAMAWEPIDEAICLLGDLTPTCSRIDGVEGYDFQHPNGEAWRVSFVGKEAVLSVNGETVASIDAADGWEIKCMIKGELKSTAERDRPAEEEEPGWPI